MSAAAGRSFYEVLGVHPHAQKLDIKNAYKRLALQSHPDKNQGDVSAKEVFQEVSNGHSHLYYLLMIPGVLKDPSGL